MARKSSQPLFGGMSGKSCRVSSALYWAVAVGRKLLYWAVAARLQPDAARRLTLAAQGLSQTLQPPPPYFTAEGAVAFGETPATLRRHCFRRRRPQGSGPAPRAQRPRALLTAAAHDMLAADMSEGTWRHRRQFGSVQCGSFP